MGRKKIPEFDTNGNLPPGVYAVSMTNIETRYAYNTKRKQLFNGLKKALENLKVAGVKKVWVNGSFITNKEKPNDIDGCWEYSQSMDVDKLDPVFLDMYPPREAMKKKYGVDFLISGAHLSDGGKTVEMFFQEDRDGNEKGILVVVF
jgi:hypothetical protein